MMRSWLMLALLAPAACKSGETRPADRSSAPVVAAKPTEAAPAKPAEAAPATRAPLPGLENHDLSDDAISLPKAELSPAAKASVLAEVAPLAPECGKASVLAARAGDHVFVLAVCPRGRKPGGNALALLTVTGDTARAIAFELQTPDPDYPDWLSSMDDMLAQGDEICVSAQSESESRGTEIFLCAPHAAGAAAARAVVAARPIPTTFEFGEPSREFEDLNTKVSEAEAIAAVRFWLGKMKTTPSAQIQKSLAKTKVAYLNGECDGEPTCLGDSVREIARAGQIEAEVIAPDKVDADFDPKKLLAGRPDLTLVAVEAFHFRRDGIESAEMIVAVTRNLTDKMVVDTVALNMQFFNPDFDH